MAQESVEVLIGVDGTVEVHVQGVSGTRCLADTDELVRLLGGGVQHQVLTEEAYRQDAAEEEDRLGWCPPPSPTPTTAPPAASAPRSPRS